MSKGAWGGTFRDAQSPSSTCEPDIRTRIYLVDYVHGVECEAAKAFSRQCDCSLIAPRRDFWSIARREIMGQTYGGRGGDTGPGDWTTSGSSSEGVKGGGFHGEQVESTRFAAREGR